MFARFRCFAATDGVFSLVSEWLLDMTVQKLVIVFRSIETNEVLERWQFDVQCDKSAKTET